MAHPSTPSSPLVYPRVTIKTVNSPVSIAPFKIALIMIDMQNFFLTAAIGRSHGEGHDAKDVLLKLGIPAARKAGLQIVWLTWRISDEGLETLPPTAWRTFGWEIAHEGDFELGDDGPDPKPDGEVRRLEKKRNSGIGSPLGDVTLENGSVVEAGGMLMRNQWNTGLHGPLESAYQADLKACLRYPLPQRAIVGSLGAVIQA